MMNCKSNAQSPLTGSPPNHPLKATATRPEPFHELLRHFLTFITVDFTVQCGALRRPDYSEGHPCSDAKRPARQ